MTIPHKTSASKPSLRIYVAAARYHKTNKSANSWMGYFHPKMAETFALLKLEGFFFLKK